MLGIVFTDDVKPSAATDNLTILTNFFNRRSYFHGSTSSPQPPLQAPGDSSPGVRRIWKLNAHSITRENTNSSYPHFACNIGNNFPVIIELHFKRSSRKGLQNNAFSSHLARRGYYHFSYLTSTMMRSVFLGTRVTQKGQRRASPDWMPAMEKTRACRSARFLPAASLLK